MNIGIDFIAINKSRNHGIGNYAEGLCRALMGNHPEHSYYLLNWSNNFLGNELFPDIVNFKEVCVGECTLSDTATAREIIKNFVHQYGIKLYLDISPLWGERPLLCHEWFGEDCYLTGIIHDFIPYVLKDKYYPSNRDGIMEYISKMFNLHQYDYLFPNSEYTKSDAHKLAKLDCNRMGVIFCSVGENRNEEKPEVFSNVAKKFGIKSKYFFYPSGDAPQKNVTELLLAYIDAKETIADIPQLVITGKFHNASYRRIRRILNYYDVNECIIFTNYVSSSELESLYQNAFWVVYPSLYEGFGMPVIEAWKHLCPVMTSNASALKEIARNCAVLIDPNNRKSIADGLIKISQFDEKQRAKYISLGRQRAKEFSWKKTADIFVHYIAGLPRAPMSYNESKEAVKFAHNLTTNEMKKWDFENPNHTGYSSQDGIEVKSRSLVRLREYFNLFERWMILRDYNLQLSWFFCEHGYEKIAIYGMGIMAQHLMMELKNTEVQIVCGIDRSARNMEDVIPILSLEDKFPLVDVIVVTVTYEYDSIKGMLSSCTDFPIVSLKQIIEASFSRYNVYNI